MKKIIYNFLSNTIFPNHKNKKIKPLKSRQFPYKIEIVAENLNVPWAIAISDERKIYFID